MRLWASFGAGSVSATSGPGETGKLRACPLHVRFPPHAGRSEAQAGMPEKGQNLSSDHILLSPSAATLPELISHAAEQNLSRRGAREVTGQRKDDSMVPPAYLRQRI